MPIWDRHCESCDELFEVNCKISEKENGHWYQCPYCGSVDGVWRPTSSAFTMRGDRLMTQKQDRGFAEVLDKIKERNKRTEISKR